MKYRTREEIREDIMKAVVASQGRCKYNKICIKANLSGPLRYGIVDKLIEEGLLEKKQLPISKNSIRKSTSKTSRFIVLTEKAINAGWV